MSQTRRVARAPVTAAAAVVLAVTRAARVLAQARGRVLRVEAQRRTSVGRKDSSRRISANLGESRRISANLGKSRRISRTGTTSVAKGEATAPLPRPPPWSGDSGRPSGSYFAEAGGPIGMAIGGLIAALLWQGRRVPGMKGRMRRSRWTRASRWTTKGDMSDSGWGGPGRDGSRENCSVARRCSSSSD